MKTAKNPPPAPLPSTPEIDAISTPPADYEAAVAELEALAAAMESGRLPLAQMLSSYRRGSFLLQYCNEQLNAVEQQIQVIEGQQLKPLDPSA